MLVPISLRDVPTLHELMARLFCSNLKKQDAFSIFNAYSAWLMALSDAPLILNKLLKFFKNHETTTFFLVFFYIK